MSTGTMRILIVGLIIAALAIPLAGIDLHQQPNTWVKRSPLADSPPCPRLGYEGACAWDSRNKLFIRYGGHNQGGGGAQYSEIWTFDPFTGKWTLREPDISPPGVCCAQQNVYDPVHGRYVRFRAFSGNHGWQWFRELYLNNSTLWVYDLDENRWRELRPAAAPKVTGLRCASWDSDAQVIVVFGGETNYEGTVVYDPHANTWTKMKPATEPPFRSGGNMVYDEAHKLHIMFGAQFTDDPITWGYDLRKNEWRDLKPAVSPPTDKNDAVLAYDSSNNVVVAIVKITTGEEENAKHRLETWAYDTAKNTWTKMNPPQEPDATGNRSRVLAFAPELGLTILENRTRSKPGPPEQQIWTYCYDRPTPESSAMVPPSNLQVTTAANAAILNWEPSPSNGATNYTIYRGTGENPRTVDYKQIATVSEKENTYRDDGLQSGVVYFYTVRAAGNGVLSEPSLKVRTQSRIVEDATVSVLSKNQVLLTWEAPKSGDVVGYHLERAEVEVWSEDQLTRLKSKVAPLAHPSVGAIKKIGPFKQITSDPLKEKTFIDKVDLATPKAIEDPAVFESRFHDDYLDRGGKPYGFGVYAYRIRAVNALGVVSGPSPYFLTIPSAPRWVFAKEDGNTCMLKWAENPEKKLKGYRVYRLDGRWEKNSISRLTREPIADLKFSDTSAGQHTRRYYVVAVDALGQEGLPSRPVWYEREWKRFYEPFTGQWHQ